jgi:hypothetical protein
VSFPQIEPLARQFDRLISEPHQEEDVTEVSRLAAVLETLCAARKSFDEGGEFVPYNKLEPLA